MTRRQNIVEAIKLLLGTLPADDRIGALEDITEWLRPIPAPRAGDVLGVVVRLLPRRHAWTVTELREEVAALGVEASAKEVYNSLGYLTRKRRINRVGYGRYEQLASLPPRAAGAG